MNTRIATLREYLGLSRAEFGEKLGVVGPAVGNWERGVQVVPQRKITLICERFNVNRDWLINGTGEVFKQNEQTKEEKQKEVTPYEYARMQGCDYIIAKAFEAICAMNDRDKAAMSRLADQLIQKLTEDDETRKKEQSSKAPKISGTNVRFRDYNENN